ncbi:MAG TPA: urease accessory protein UreE [Pseudolabrys sp.]|nr:urease accessory protein UreE [Pseudolabrys sp.]
MLRATSVINAAHRHGRPVADIVILDYAQRSAEKVTVTGAKGTVFDIDLHMPVRLRTDDLLLLDDGTLVEVVAAPEPLIEARASDLAGLSRLAWHLGDRHIPVQVLTNRVRARREAAVETLLTSLGAKVTMIDAPFEPEGGAYALSQAHDHGHHGHSHHDHDDCCGGH